MTKTEIRRMVTAAAAACEDKKANNISILELDPADSGFTDYFLIASGTNERQNQAIASGIEDAMERQFHTRVHSIEGYRQGEWILLDYVDFVVHIFSEEKRDFYDIERLRKTATKLGLEELKASLKEKVTAVRKKQAAKKTATQKTPAKKSPAKKSIKPAATKPPKGKATKPRAAAKKKSAPKKRKPSAPKN